MVSTAFTLSGSVDDYDAAAHASIRAVLASEVGVATAAVQLHLAAGSVLVAAEIIVASVSAADAAISTLSAGVLASADALQTALTAQFEADGVSTATLVVEEITQAPQLPLSSTMTPAAATATSDEDNSLLLAGVVGAALGGCACALCALVLAIVAICRQRRRRRWTHAEQHAPVPADAPNDQDATGGVARRMQRRIFSTQAKVLEVTPARAAPCGARAQTSVPQNSTHGAPDESSTCSASIELQESEVAHEAKILRELQSHITRMSRNGSSAQLPQHGEHVPRLVDQDVQEASL